MSSASEDDELYLGHILEAVEKIQAYTAPGHSEFMEEKLDKVRLAVEALRSPDR